MNPPLEPWNDPTLEARVVACVLGEASAFERAEIDRLLSESPELAAFARRIRAVHGLLGEATRGGAEDIWKMEPERRGKLLLALGAPAPASQAVAMPARKKRRFTVNLLTLAATIAFGLVASTLFFSAGSGGRSNVARYKIESPGIDGTEKPEMVALATEMPGELLRGASKDVSDALVAHKAKRENAEGLEDHTRARMLRMVDQQWEVKPTGERNEVAASAPSKPSSSASVITMPSARPSPPAAPLPPSAEPLVADSKFNANLGLKGDKPSQVAITTKNVEVRQKNTEELGYDWFVADENGKAQGGDGGGAGAKGWAGAREGADNQAEAGEVALNKSGAGALDFDGFMNYGATINGPTDGRRSGNAPVTRGEIDGILKGQEARLDELSDREDVAKIEVIRELKPGDVGVTTEVNPRGVIVAGVATDLAFPVTPATPTDFEERVDSFGNPATFPTEYEPPELPNAVGQTRDDVSRTGQADAPVLGDIPAVGRLFRDRWETTASEDASIDTGVALTGKAEGEKSNKPDENVDPFAAPTDMEGSDGDVDPFAAAPATDETGTRAAPEEKKLAPVPPAAPSMENKLTEAEPVSTFSLHVSDASFQLGAQALLGGGAFPAPESVRAEDYVNAMDYGDAMPTRGEAVSAVIQQSGQPFVPGRNLLRIGVRTAADGRAQGQPLSLVLLVDQSGSMERPDRATAMDRALGELAGLLGKDDTITVIGFARQPRVLADRLSGDKAANLSALIRNSPPQGGTNLEAAFDLAAELAARQAKPGAQNRIVLFTDGAANLGQIDPETLGARVEALRRQRIAFDACGVGTADLADNILEAMTRRGDGRYLVLDAEGETSLAKQLAGAFRPAARNVKVQVRFNPERVEAYQLFGFEKHLLNEEDFRDDSVDAAELAAAEQGNALYQVKLRADGHGDIGDVAVRFQDTSTGRMVERHWTIPYDPATPALDQAAPAMQLAASAGLLAESLRGSPIGQSIDPAALVNVRGKLRTAFPGDQRVATLIAMWERVCVTRP